RSFFSIASNCGLISRVSSCHTSHSGLSPYVDWEPTHKPLDTLLEHAKKNFDQDAKDRVVRLVEDRIVAENMSMHPACQAVAPKLGVSWHTARQWT
ncbi:hypothetical protein GWO73_03845, partial [Corynebacterium macginleyi]|nr:hypothetical protein [Corynebacterium macginleyi]